MTKPLSLSDLLIDDWIAVPLEADDLQGALRRLIARLRSTTGAGPEVGSKLARDLAFGTQGEVIRVDEDIVLVAGRMEDLEDVSVLLGVSSGRFTVTAEGRKEPGTARVLLLLLTPRRITTLKDQFLPALVRVLRQEETARRLLQAGTHLEVRGLDELMEVELHERLLVEDALQPLKYRIYPDTPLAEIVDLMVRRELNAVPVVGESLEVLGIISVGDALRHLLPRRGREGEGGSKRTSTGALTARDVMTRTVMCVAEDQSLYEAANLMVNRDVDQLPVVRDGELIGSLDRQAILRSLFGVTSSRRTDDRKR